jgi:hypothetical protein
MLGSICCSVLFLSIYLLKFNNSEATIEKLVKLSDGFTWPIIIRGLLGNNSEGVEKWKDRNW